MYLGLSSLIISALFLATLFIEFQIYKSPSSERLNNRKRIRSWWIILAICLPIFYLKAIPLVAFIYALSIWACWEFSRLLTAKISLLTIMALSAMVLIPFYLLKDDIVIGLSLLPFVVMLMAFALRHSSLLPLFSILFITSALATLIIIAYYCELNLTCHSSSLLLYLFLMTAINDISQYVSGKLLGKTPFAPKISPNKTREGALGGIIFTSLLGMITLPFVIETISSFQALVTAGLLSIMGIAGDLYFSYFKRKAGVKNSGESIPGHGGLLDRIDSLLFTAPVFNACILILLKG